MAEWTLFLDDERFPVDPDEVICRTIKDAVLEISHRGPPTVIRFDHDLGGTETGLEFVKILIDLNQSEVHGFRFPDNFSFTVHSQNPIGAENIRSLLTQYLEWRRDV